MKHNEARLNGFSNAEEMHRKHDPIVWLVSELLGQYPRVIDLGCGTGRLIHEVGDALGVEYLGIDSEPELIEIAAELHPEGRWLVADIFDLWPEGVPEGLIFLCPTRLTEVEQEVCQNLHKVLRGRKVVLYAYSSDMSEESFERLLIRGGVRGRLLGQSYKARQGQSVARLIDWS